MHYQKKSQTTTSSSSRKQSSTTTKPLYTAKRVIYMSMYSWVQNHLTKPPHCAPTISCPVCSDFWGHWTIHLQDKMSTLQKKRYFLYMFLSKSVCYWLNLLNPYLQTRCVNLYMPGQNKLLEYQVLIFIIAADLTKTRQYYSYERVVGSADIIHGYCSRKDLCSYVIGITIQPFKHKYIHSHIAPVQKPPYIKNFYNI